MPTAKRPVPTTASLTRDAAIARLVDLDVARYGEAERTVSQEMRGRLTHGLALNALAHYDVDAIDADLAEAAKRVMTDADWRVLRYSVGSKPYPWT